MEPDPIRQAYDAYCKRVGNASVCSLVDFAAGAKWAATQAALIVIGDPYGAEKEQVELADKIRKHFGVED